MIIKKTSLTKRIHHEVEVSGHIVYRNEELEYDDITDTWKRLKLRWSIGSRDGGGGPFHTIEDRWNNSKYDDLKSFPYQTTWHAASDLP